jgi:hypothetical protein
VVFGLAWKAVKNEDTPALRIYNQCAPHLVMLDEVICKVSEISGCIAVWRGPRQTRKVSINPQFPLLSTAIPRSHFLMSSLARLAASSRTST